MFIFRADKIKHGLKYYYKNESSEKGHSRQTIGYVFTFEGVNEKTV